MGGVHSLGVDTGDIVSCIVVEHSGVRPPASRMLRHPALSLWLGEPRLDILSNCVTRQLVDPRRTITAAVPGGKLHNHLVVELYRGAQGFNSCLSARRSVCDRPRHYVGRIPHGRPPKVSSALGGPHRHKVYVVYDKVTPELDPIRFGTAGATDCLRSPRRVTAVAENEGGAFLV